MEFQNEMQKNVHAMLGNWFAADLQSGAIHKSDDRPAFFIRQGSAIVVVSVGAIGNDEASITVGAQVVTGARVTGELMAFLLGYNHGSLFGAFGMNPENGTITFDHSIVGSTCDHKELVTSISIVAMTADRYDDAIIEKFGGKSALALASGQ
jgi:hypothetical protein